MLNRDKFTDEILVIFIMVITIITPTTKYNTKIFSCSCFCESLIGVPGERGGWENKIDLITLKVHLRDGLLKGDGLWFPPKFYNIIKIIKWIF